MPEPNQSQTAASQGDDALFFSMGSSLDSDDSEDPTGGKTKGKDVSQLPSFIHQKSRDKGKTRGEGKATGPSTAIRLTPGAHNIP